MSQHPGSLVARSFAASDVSTRLVRAVHARAVVDVGKTVSAARPFVTAALWRELGGQLIVWTATPDIADRFAADCAFFAGDDGDVAWSIRPRDDSRSDSPTAHGARMEALVALIEGRPGIYCVPHTAMRQRVMTAKRFARASVRLRAGEEFAWELLLALLESYGYKRTELVTAVGEYAVRGGILDVFPTTADAAARLEFDGDRVAAIRRFALNDQRSLGAVSDVLIAPWSDIEGPDDDGSAAKQTGCILDYAPHAVVVVDEPDAVRAVDAALGRERDDATILAAELEGTISGGTDGVGPIHKGTIFDGPTTGSGTGSSTGSGTGSTTTGHTIAELERRLEGRGVVRYVGAIASHTIVPPADERVAIHAEPAPSFARDMTRFVEFALACERDGQRLIVVSVGHRRIREALAEHEVTGAEVVDGTIDAGFALTAQRVVILGDAELFGHAARRIRLKAVKEGVPLTLADLRIGEYFVHARHGIGKYLGLEHLEIDHVARDFMLLQYAGSDRLYVPVDQMHLVRKYNASDDSAPRLSRLGGGDWARTRSRVREQLETIAEGLVKLYAARETAQGYAFGPDTPWQQELEEAFPYEETPDQLTAITETKRDMERPRPMDRLVCGDVGYGKTEVAMRAAFKAIMDRKQVALLAPTTVLAAQHFRTFGERFAAYPVRIELLSRFRDRAQQKVALRGLADGSVDLVIGTHRILQKDVGFKNLGLVIVDEEQRFGVMHKERLKELRRSVDVLTLSATPIPRTLHMAMVGVRDLSLIQTPPANRVSIKTSVAPTSDALVASALRAELDRGGQAYFVHNRVDSIYGVAAAIQKLAPRARIAVGHGQMDKGELERVMLGFVEGEFDVLVATTIIENGLDIPNVNTIIINNANAFGLSTLYQLRGRVGRSAHQAYAYFLYQPHRSLSAEAQARLDAIREFSTLGSGLQLALRDLEIRGAGNILGVAQSGFIAAVGFETYCDLLQEAIAQQRGEPRVEEAPPPVFDLAVSAYLPNDYVHGASQKIALYQRLAAARSLADVDDIAEELRDRFGTLPASAVALLDLTRVRILASSKGVEKVALEGRKLTLDVGRRFTLSERSLPALSSLTQGQFRITPGSIIAHLPARDGALGAVRDVLAAL